MGLVITETPQKSVNGQLSKWQSVHLPIIFKLQRQDVAIQMKYKPGGLDVILKVVGFVPADVVVGDRVKYINGTVEHTWSVTAINGLNIQTDGTIPGTLYGGYIILLDSRKNYFVRTTIRSVDVTNTYVDIGTALSKSDVNGLIKINVYEWLKTKAVFKNEFAYDVINKAIIGEGGKFSILFREVYNGVEQPLSSVTIVRYWTNSSKQVQQEFGSNMGTYVPTIDLTRDPQAAFQSVFPKATYWPNFPFSLSFIYSDNMQNLAITREEEQFDVNGNSVTTSSTNLDWTQRFFANRLMLEQGYPSTVKELDVWLNSGAVIPDSTVVLQSTGYDDNTVFDPMDPTDGPPYAPIERN